MAHEKDLYPQTFLKKDLAYKGFTYLPINTLPVVVILRIAPLLPLVSYLLPLNSLKRYITKDSIGNSLFTTALRNISVVRYGMSLVTKLLLDLAKIQ